MLCCGRKPNAERALLLVVPVLRCDVGGLRPKAARADALEPALAWLLELASPKARSADVLECWDPPSMLLRRRAPPGLIGSSTACDNHSVMVSSGAALGLGFSHW